MTLVAVVIVGKPFLSNGCWPGQTLSFVLSAQVRENDKNPLDLSAIRYG